LDASTIRVIAVLAMKPYHFWLPAIVLACACTSSDDPPLDPLPPANGVQLTTSPSYKLAPGQETYMCYQFYSPKDKAVAITNVDTISMVGIHHMALFQAGFGVLEPNAPHPCPDLIKTTWLPIFVSGTGSHELALPEGTGFIIQPNTQYILQLHLLNATDNDLDIRAGINLTYSDDASSLIPAGIFAIGTQSINIPPNTTNYQLSESCPMGQKRNVFAVFPHMHYLGTEMDVVLQPGGAGSGSPFYTIDPWVFGSQPVTPITYVSQPSDVMTVTCHWNNPGSSPVVYGELSTNEMCYFIMFYYPYTELDGCIG
jgi:hypothetical protein